MPEKSSSISKLFRIAKDYALSVIASVIYTFARQIVVFPFLAEHLTEADYGTMLTVVGLVNVFTALVGGTLNNIRLIRATAYEEEGKKGDFLWLCLWGSVLGVAGCVALGFIFDLSVWTVVILSVYIVINNFYQYATAYFRLKLNFLRNFIVNVVASVAYVASCFFFASATLWPLIFLCGELAGLVYTVITTKFYKESFSRTPLLRTTTTMYLQLALVNLISNLLMYADRMILYPILGAESVSYYSTASFFGKSAGMVMVPIAGVLLGYFSQKNFRATKKRFLGVNALSLAVLAVFMLFCIPVAPWFTKILYPTLFEESAPYILLANLGAVISIAGNMAQPMLLKACSTRDLIIIQIAFGVIYLASSLWLLPLYGLYGFCWATILSNLFRLLSFYVLGLLKIGTKGETREGGEENAPVEEDTIPEEKMTKEVE